MFKNVFSIVPYSARESMLWGCVTITAWSVVTILP